VSNLSSKYRCVRCPDAAWGLADRCSTSDGQSSSPDQQRARCGGVREANAILNIKWRHKERLGSSLTLSQIAAATKAFSQSTRMLTFDAHPLRLRMGRELVHSGSPK
jgi:hypothetical protein